MYFLLRLYVEASCGVHFRKLGTRLPWTYTVGIDRCEFAGARRSLAPVAAIFSASGAT